MLRVPRAEEIAAKGVGIQMWRCEETAFRNGDVGSQWSGRVAVSKLCNDGWDIILCECKCEYARV